MVTTIKTANKNLNFPKLMEELNVIPFTEFGLLMAGFHKLNVAVFEPNAGTQVISSSTVGGVVTENTAEPGELRFRTDDVIDGATDTAIDAVLTAHDFTIKTAEQDRQDTDSAQVIQLKDDFNNWDGMDATQRDVVTKRMLRSLVRLIMSRDADI